MGRVLKTKKGNTRRRKAVELDMKGLNNFQNALGPKGVTFKLGLFTQKAATKGALLEYGNDRQVARPWLSQALTGKTVNEMLELMPELVEEAVKGNNIKDKISKKMLPILQQHLLQQRFSVPALRPDTIRQKRKKGARDPQLIGIDTFHMATMLDVRGTGGKSKRKKQI